MFGFRYPAGRRAYLLTPAVFAGAAALLSGTVTILGGPAWAAGRGASGPRWSVQPTPSALVANGALAADACPSPDRCIAVGSYESSSGTSALAESWNGTAWSVRPVPVPAGGTHSILDGVSCSSATACTAVGDYISFTGAQVTLAERWDGRSWSPQPAPGPGTDSAILTGVSCPEATSCVAVGAYQFPDKVFARLVESWNGTRWALRQTKGPPNSADSALYGVSCTAAAACVAVGHYLAEPSDDWVTLAQAWNGSTWRDTPSPNAKGSIVDTLYGVSCAATACTAVGDSIAGAGPDSANSAGSPLGPALAEAWTGRDTATDTGSPLGSTLAEAWNGSTWTIQPSPNPPGTSGVDELDGVSCRSATSCDAVGYATSADGNGGKTLGESWNGTAWTIGPTPDPGPYYNSLAGVSCASAASCTAVGYYRNSSGTHLTLGLAGDGSSWAAEATPSRVGAVPSVLTGVSCASPTACTAVGYFDNSPGTVETLAEAWNGTRWTAQYPPNPAGFGHNSLVGVSCTSSSACVAVGRSYNTESGTTLAESWNGKAWTIQPAATGVTSGELQAVSCTSATACTAVGYGRNVSDEAIPLAESWNGAAWTVQNAASPPGGSSIVLNGVSCTSPGACTAVGSYVQSAADVGLAERWNGTDWTIQATPAGDDILSGVSCVTPAMCVAVGDFYTFEHIGTLAEEWRDGTWHLGKAPPINTYFSSLLGVACRSATACAAVGGYDDIYKGDVAVTLAEAWNGRAWSIQHTSAPRSGSNSVLAGVASTSSTSSTAFTAVGSHLSGAQVSVTLAETGPG